VWVVYGKKDPWTTLGCIEKLKKNCIRPDGIYSKSLVEGVVALEGTWRFPHDEVSERANELILDFLDRLE